MRTCGAPASGFEALLFCHKLRVWVSSAPVYLDAAPSVQYRYRRCRVYEQQHFIRMRPQYLLHAPCRALAQRSRERRFCTYLGEAERRVGRGLAMRDALVTGSAELYDWCRMVARTGSKLPTRNVAQLASSSSSSRRRTSAGAPSSLPFWRVGFRNHGRLLA